MAAIVAPAPLDIPFGLNPAPALVDPAVPRAVLAHSLASAAAAVLAPALQPTEPEYRLAAKRKTPDDGEPEPNDHPKRPRADDDPLFGPLCTPPTSSATPATTDVLGFAFEQAIVAIFTTPVQQEATSQPPPAPTPPTPEPAPPVQPPANAVAGPSRIPTSPLASPSLLPPFEEAEAPTPIIPRAYRPPRPMRIVEPPLWKVACRTRVETIIDSYGVAAVRATVAHEVSRRPDRSPLGSTGSRLAGEAMAAGGDLQVEIYTPSHFVTTTSSPDVDASAKSEFELEDDVDMSFDLDDSDGESEEDEAEYEESPHESVVDLPSPTDDVESSPSAAGPCAPLLSPILSSAVAPIGSPICLPSLPPMAPPSLPHLASVPVWCLRTYPDLPRRGTPPRAAPWARGQLSTRKNLTISVMRATGPRMVGL